MTDYAIHLLQEIAQSRRYPVVRFELRSSKDRSLRSTALSHVRLQTPDEGLEEIKVRGAALQELEQAGLIVIDYSLPVTLTSDYAVYQESAAFQLLQKTVEEGKKHPDFLFDQAVIRRGMARITSRGRKAYHL